MGKKMYRIRSNIAAKKLPRTEDEVLKCTNFSMKVAEYSKYVLNRVKSFQKERNKLLRISNRFYGFNCLEHLNTPSNMQIGELYSEFSEHLVQKAPVVVPNGLANKLLKCKKELLRKDKGTMTDENGKEHFIENFYYGVNYNNKYYTFCTRHHVKINNGYPIKEFNAGIYLLMDGKYPVELSRYDSSAKSKHYRRFDDEGNPTRKMISLKIGDAHFQDYNEKQLVIFPYDMCHYDTTLATKYKTFQEANSYLCSKWGLERIGEANINLNDHISKHIARDKKNSDKIVETF